MTCRVEISIETSAEIVWSLLTDRKRLPALELHDHMASTVTSVKASASGCMCLGTNRTFRPTVSGVVPARRMVWGDGLALIFKGVRTFVLKPRDDASTDFVMEERFSGVRSFALTKSAAAGFPSDIRGLRQ